MHGHNFADVIFRISLAALTVGYGLRVLRPFWASPVFAPESYYRHVLCPSYLQNNTAENVASNRLPSPYMVEMSLECPFCEKTYTHRNSLGNHKRTRIYSPAF